MTDGRTPATRRFNGRLCLLLGVVLAVVGRVAYVVQFYLQDLRMPWYMPVMSLLGVVLVVVSLLEKRTVWRLLAFFLVGLLATAEIAFLDRVRLPPYSGPIQAGLPFPAFATRRADGELFTHHELISGDQNILLVFFRGRW